MSFVALAVVVRRLAGIASLAVACAAAAQPGRGLPGTPTAQAAIETFDVEQVEQLRPGVPLRFAVYGSTGGTVTLYIEGAKDLLELAESEPGIYEGIYVADARDRVRSESKVVATLQWRGRVVRMTLEEPLVLAVAPSPWTAAQAETNAPSIPQREREPPGAPLAWASPRPVPARIAEAPAAAPPRAGCDDCAVVESIRGIDAPPARGGPLGKASGAVFGALFGDEVAEAHLSRVRRVFGPVGRALVGPGDHAGDGARQYDVLFRLPDGSTRQRRYDGAPGLQPGDAVSLSGATR